MAVITRKNSIRYFERLINAMSIADKFYLNKNIQHQLDKVGSNKWNHIVTVNDIRGQNFTIDFTVHYNIKKNTPKIKINGWTENGVIIDDFTGFTQPGISEKFTYYSATLATHNPKKIYEWDRKAVRESAVIEQVLGIDDFNDDETVYLPIKLVHKERSVNGYHIKLPTGVVFRASIDDVDKTCIRIINRKAVK